MALGLLSSCSARASHCGCFSCSRARRLQSLRSSLGLVALRHVGSSQTGDGTRVSSTGRQILNHWTTREVPVENNFLRIAEKKRERNVPAFFTLPPLRQFEAKNSGTLEHGTPLQYSCLENSMDGGAWWAAIHGVAKSRTRLSDFTFTFHFPALEKEMATHSTILAWRIPGTAEPGGLLSMGSRRVGHD